MLEPLHDQFPHARPLLLDGAELALVPLCEQLFHDIDLPGFPLGPDWAFDRLSSGVAAVLTAASRVGPVVYLEADYAGGLGRQSAVAWLDCYVVYGPNVLLPDEPFPVSTPDPRQRQPDRAGAALPRGAGGRARRRVRGARPRPSPQHPRLVRGVVTGLSAAPGVRAVLDDVAVLGPAFTLATDPAEAGQGHLVPLERLLAEPGVLRTQVDAAAAELGSGEARVAASWVFGGMAARLVAPVLAAAAVHGALPVLAGADLRWRGPDAPAGRPGGSPHPASCRGATPTTCTGRSSGRSLATDEPPDALARSAGCRLLRATDRAPRPGRGSAASRSTSTAIRTPRGGWSEVNGGPQTVPARRLPDGTVVTNPEPREVLAALGQ